jgi:hypothetical protein
MPADISCILLNWKRPYNIESVIHSIRMQTIKSKIILFDNSGVIDRSFDHKADIVFRCSKNFHCLPRYMLAGWIFSDYIFSIDDDFIIKDENLFLNLISESKEYDNKYALCYNGCKLAKTDRPYWDSVRDIEPGEKDVCNFGICFYKTELIGSFPLNPFAIYSENEMKYGDDIIASNSFQCRVSKHIGNAVESIENDEYGLSKQPLHMPIRDSLCKKLIL